MADVPSQGSVSPIDILQHPPHPPPGLRWIKTRAVNEGPRRFHNLGGGPYWVLLLVGSYFTLKNLSHEIGTPEQKSKPTLLTGGYTLRIFANQTARLLQSLNKALVRGPSPGSVKTSRTFVCSVSRLIMHLGPDILGAVILSPPPTVPRQIVSVNPPAVPGK